MLTIKLETLVKGFPNRCLYLCDVKLNEWRIQLGTNMEAKCPLMGPNPIIKEKKKTYCRSIMHYYIGKCMIVDRSMLFMLEFELQFCDKQAKLSVTNLYPKK